MSQLVKVRYVFPEDFDKILEIESLNHILPSNGELVKDQRQLSKKQIMEFISDSRTRLIIGTVDGIVEGFVLLDARDPNNVILKRLSVNKKRQGVGSILLKESIKLAEKARANRITVYIYEEDDQSIAFYNKLGFKSKFIKARERVNNKSFDEIEFSKKIGE